MTKSLTLDEILGTKSPETELDRRERAEGEAMLSSEVVQRAINRARWETVEQDSAFFVGCLLQGIEALTNGNLLASGQAIDNALTHYLSDLKARTGDGYSVVAAAALISNIALFLPPAQEAAVRKALEGK